jgi:hypothetical protein
VQMRKKNSRQRLFQTCEALSSSASAVNAYGRFKIQYLCWPAPTSGLPTLRELIGSVNTSVFRRWLREP